MKTLLSLVLSLVLSASLSAQDWEVWPTGATEVATGKVYSSKDQGPLKLAVLNSAAGDVIEVHGHVAGFSVGIGENFRRNEVVRADPVRVTIVGTPGAVMGAWAVGGKKKPGGAPGFAVEYLALVDITVDGRTNQSPMAGFFKSEYGDIVLSGVELLSSKTKTKWGCRVMGQARSFTAESCKLVGGGQEHAFYIDNPATFATFRNNAIDGWGRTGVQVVTREFPVAGWPNPGVATGDCIIESNVVKNCGWEGGNGGSGLTVAGWPLGTVRYDGNVITSKHEVGAIVAYTDFKLGTLALPGGYGFSHVVVGENSGTIPNGVRAVMGFQRIKHLEFRIGEKRKFVVENANRGIDLAINGGKCELVEIHARDEPSLLPGVSSPREWTEGKLDVDPDVYWVDPGEPRVEE